MSTKLHDIPNNAVLAVGCSPRVATATVTGGTLDFITGDGRCTAVQLVGTVGGTAPTLAGKIQESSDQSTWTDVSGATFTTVSASDNSQVISFDRTKRYLRYIGTIGGTSPTVPMSAAIMQQKKQI